MIVSLTSVRDKRNGKLQIWFVQNNLIWKEFSIVDIVTVFCEFDDFYKIFEPVWKKRLLGGGRVRHRRTSLSPAEVMTILVMYQASGCKNLKSFYLQDIGLKYRREFPHQLSYQRFVELQSRCVMSLFFLPFVQARRLHGHFFHWCDRLESLSLSADSVTPRVCGQCRAAQIFDRLVLRLQTAFGSQWTGRDFGILSDGAGNVDEHQAADWITQECWGKLVGDKAYLSKDLFEKLMARGLRLITKLRKNMKNQFVEMEDKILLRKRAIIKTINDQLKNISNIEHTPPKFMELFKQFGID